MRIQRVVLSLVLLGGCLLTALPARAAQAAARRMANADVVQMLAAGLSDDIIMAAIRQAPERGFDLSVSGLIALKKAKASDALILFMQNVDAAPAPAAAAAPAPRPVAATSAPVSGAGVPAMVKGEDGVYYFDGRAVHRVEAKAPYQTRTGSRAVSRLTLGIKKARLNAMLPGLSSDLQITDTPSFYVHLDDDESIGEYYLLRFTVKQEQGRRELEVGSAGLGKAQAGFAEKDIFLVEATRLEQGIYMVTPKTALPAGEYGLLVVPQATASGQTGLTPRKIFDFGVR
jgi:hypothetical protein